MERNLLLDWESFVTEAITRRKEQKFTQEQFAVLAGVSKPTLSNFEQGKTNIKLDSALRILKALGLLKLKPSVDNSNLNNIKL